MPPPFVLLGTPRSRTAWLAELLSFGGVECLHEPSIDFQSLDDLKALLDRPNVGAADSLMTLLWRDILAFRPDTRIVVVRRPVGEVVDSFERLGKAPRGTLELVKAIDHQAELLSHQPGVLSVPFADLTLTTAVQGIAKHLLDAPLPLCRLRAFQSKNIQCSLDQKDAQAERNREGFARVFGPHLPVLPRCVVVVVNRPAYRIALEDLFGLTFGHVEFHMAATHKTLRECRRDVDAVMALHGGTMHAMAGLITAPAELRRHSKFMALMGFTVARLQPCIDGVDRPLYFREASNAN